MKLIVTASLVAALGFGGFFVYNLMSSKTTIDQVIAHFEQSGVPVRIKVNTAEEQKFVDDFKARVAAAGLEGKGESDYEDEEVFLGSLPASSSIRRYKKSSDARKYYDKEVLADANEKERYANRPQSYAQDDYFIKDNVVLDIKHYNLEIVVGLVPRPVNLDPVEYERVIRAFNTL